MAYTGDESPWRWALTMFLGFAIEVIGVTTGLLFGAYEYGSGLGPKALRCPCSWACDTAARTIGQTG